MDSRLSLSLSMQSNPGIYALLLGSGISRPAGIPTGAEVVENLIERIAAIEGEDVPDEPMEWYRTRYDKEPDYSTILARAARTRAERQGLLKGYFEPDQQEKEEGLKQPTKAHHAIADLCSRGYIRVVITTNFDPLLEQALESKGVRPTIIATDDAVQGAPPLEHVDLLLLKVNGDYLDTRIRNTTGEMESYSDALNGLLDQIFDRYGLIVSGWSANSDIALRRAIERCKSRRYSTYWTGLEDPGEDLQRLLDLRDAQFIQVEDADTFFDGLNETIASLEEISRPHPLSVETAAATIKRYLPESRHDIRFHELILTETERVKNATGSDRFSTNSTVNESAILRRVQAYEAETELLRAIFATTCYWAEERHESTLTRVVEFLGGKPWVGGKTGWLKMRYYPALLLLYVGGIAAVANDNYAALRAILLEPKIRRRNSEYPAAVALSKWKVFTDRNAQQLPNLEGNYVALSNWLEPRLRESLAPTIRDDTRYELAFDRFEYLWGLTVADLREEPDGEVRGPVGRFIVTRTGLARRTHEVIGNEIEAQGSSWGPITVGFFGGDVEHLKTLKEAYDAFWQALPYV